jgi:inorganic pyrophosphatase
MANLNIKPQKYMLNLIHVLDAYADKDSNVVNALIEINSRSINKYELITETGHLKLDRVGYSSLHYPFVYGGIPKTLDEDNDPLDIMIVNVTEPLIPGSVAEARIIGLLKFEDGGEVDDKVIAVLNDDKRVEHIKEVSDLGEHFLKETIYYWEHYKDLKKPGTCKVKGFFDVSEAIKTIDACIERYDREIKPNVE